MSTASKNIIRFLNDELDPFKYSTIIADVSSDDTDIIYNYKSDALFLNIKEISEPVVRAVKALQGYFKTSDDDSLIYTSTAVYKCGNNTVIVFPVCIGMSEYISFEGAYDWIEDVTDKLKGDLGERFRYMNRAMRWDYEEELTYGLIRIVLETSTNKTSRKESNYEKLNNEVEDTIINGCKPVSLEEHCDKEIKDLEKYVSNLEAWMQNLKRVQPYLTDETSFKNSLKFLNDFEQKFLKGKESSGNNLEKILNKFYNATTPDKVDRI